MEKKAIRCFTCGNFSNHELVYHHTADIFYDIIETEEGFYEGVRKFHYFNYKCSSCSALTIIGGFENEIDLKKDIYERLYPGGPSIRLEPHKLPESKQLVPQRVLKAYEEIWFLQKQAPNAFANQIRRCLEMICNDFNAQGKTLFAKLNNLKNNGLIPGQNEELTRVIREVGNMGSHDEGYDLDIWDVELLDELFKTIVEYLYLVPAKLKRLNIRLETSKKYNSNK